MPGPDFWRPLVLSGPSGVGKSTLLSRLFAEFPDAFGFSVSHTTRSPRPGEIDGTHYHFVTRDAFLAMRERGAFVESAEFSGNLYGTSHAAIRAVQALGRRCILDIEAQGVRQLKQSPVFEGAKESPDSLPKPVYVFIAPPTLADLRARLAGRGTDTQEAVQKRLATALKEIEYASSQPAPHDLVLVNDDLDRAYALFKQIALGEQVAADAMPAYNIESAELKPVGVAS
ncbi:guanylate kinase [Schizophyllum commune H4-8]|uniref:Guanylate kinase n=1 Tax=Schizophyllum commune (strain H4-8 / FGSC 9210) TaxID=578458 RepID=D8Q3C4_SCHCM|nr:guanylate kinase [Schizophyllum commune H4-8]KAI5894829.1 guanylate kinase [Schizophyllum commune H4-8]